MEGLGLLAIVGVVAIVAYLGDLRYRLERENRALRNRLTKLEHRCGRMDRLLVSPLHRALMRKGVITPQDLTAASNELAGETDRD